MERTEPRLARLSRRLRLSRIAGGVPGRRPASVPVLAIVIALGLAGAGVLGLAGTARAQATLCPDGSWVDQGPCQICPDGSWIGAGSRCVLTPSGTYVPDRGEDIQLAPDGTWVPGGNKVQCPDGSWVVGTRCVMAPDGTWIGTD